MGQHLGTAKTIRFTEAQLKLLEQAKKKAKLTYPETIAAALEQYVNNTVDVPAVLRAAADKLEALKR
jgi:hypothetical protein